MSPHDFPSDEELGVSPIGADVESEPPLCWYCNDQGCAECAEVDVDE